MLKLIFIKDIYFIENLQIFEMDRIKLRDVLIWFFFL